MFSTEKLYNSYHALDKPFNTIIIIKVIMLKIIMNKSTTTTTAYNGLGIQVPFEFWIIQTSDYFPLDRYLDPNFVCVPFQWMVVLFIFSIDGGIDWLIVWSQLHCISTVLLLELIRFESWPSTAWLTDTPIVFCAWAVACMNYLSSAISSPHGFPPSLPITAQIFQTNQKKKMELPRFDLGEAA